MEEKLYEKVRLEVGEWRGSWSDVQEVDFMGRLLADSRVETGDLAHPDNSGTAYKVYETIGGKFVYWKEDWDRWQGATTVAKMEVFDNINELEYSAPLWLVRDAKRALGLDVVEHLDI